MAGSSVAFVALLAIDPLGCLAGDPLPSQLALILPALGAIVTVATVALLVSLPDILLIGPRPQE